MVASIKIEDMKPISNFVLLALQVDGFCQAMSVALQVNQPVGEVSADLLRKFIDEATRVGQGGAFQKYPEIGNDATTADLLAVASVLRSTLWAFLDTPSRGDVAEASHAFGLAAIHEHRRARPDVLDTAR